MVERQSSHWLPDCRMCPSSNSQKQWYSQRERTWDLQRVNGITRSRSSAFAKDDNKTRDWLSHIPVAQVWKRDVGHPDGCLGRVGFEFLEVGYYGFVERGHAGYKGVPGCDDGGVGFGLRCGYQLDRKSNT